MNDTKVIEGITESGFIYTIKQSSLENFELLDVLADIDENPLLLPKLLNMLLDEGQKKALYDHVRLEDGTVPTSKIEKEIIDIFTNRSELKN